MKVSSIWSFLFGLLVELVYDMEIYTHQNIPKFHLTSWCGIFVEMHGFCRVFDHLPESLRKLCVSAKFPHQQIRWMFGILRSDIKQLFEEKNWSQNIFQFHQVEEMLISVTKNKFKLRLTSSPHLRVSCSISLTLLYQFMNCIIPCVFICSFHFWISSYVRDRISPEIQIDNSW